MTLQHTLLAPHGACTALSSPQSSFRPESKKGCRFHILRRTQRVSRCSNGALSAVQYFFFIPAFPILPIPFLISNLWKGTFLGSYGRRTSCMAHRAACAAGWVIGSIV